MKVLVTGGAGYVGSVLVRRLLNEGYHVRVLDKLMYNGYSLIPYFGDAKFEFVKGDILDPATVRECIHDVDFIIHLAAIVGYPACKKDENLAKDVNVFGTRLIDKNRSKSQPILFASTGSNYGALVGDICTEETPLNPLTIYGRTKTEAEKMLLDSGSTVCYRFATAFGLSPRLRLDLLVNDFVFQAVKKRNLIIYEKNYKRTFIHVRDMVRSFLFAMDNYEKMENQVFNVGSEKLNHSKEDVALCIKEKIDFYLHFADIGKDEDQRNYQVSYEKIRKLGFETTISLDQGIDELIRGYELIEVKNPFSNV